MPAPLGGDAATSPNARSASMAPSQVEAMKPAPGKVDKRSMDYVLRTGLAGGMAGCGAKTVVAPLDRVKILFQTSNPQYAKYSGSWTGVISALREVKNNDGLRGLFRGHSATLLRIFPYAGIKFLAYEQIRDVFIPSPAFETPGRRLVSGSLAGITSVFFTYPLEVIRVRLAFETKQGRSKGAFARICKQIYNEHPPPPYTAPHPSSTFAQAAASSQPVAAVTDTASAIIGRAGLSNFYRGFTPTMWGMLPYAGTSFLTHDTVGDWLRHPLVAKYTTIQETPTGRAGTTASRPRLTNAAQLTAGAVAGLVSQTASYPLEIIRRRMQVGGAVGDGRRLSMKQTAGMIWRERGFRGFWVGLGIGYVKVVPMVAVSFWVYERGKWVLGV